MKNSYIASHDIKNYDQLNGIAWDKLTESERKVAIDAAKHILDQRVIWKDKKD